MGLDMYLSGKKFLWTDWNVPDNNPKVDGYELKKQVLRLGYWRKHPNLHGYIVATFANGVDDCEEIELTKENIEQIIKAVEEDVLPETTGFFFGVSCPEQKEETLKILRDALSWMTTEDKKAFRSVSYHASW